ncbi:hypothetical protein ACQPXM_02200 [Kribbella sp. CA-253562]|uniref:hypothetical protein n=1 Tax=Kribbella sp. CA-253562 TaxID=3239942 RepID=UPI003D932B8B
MRCLLTGLAALGAVAMLLGGVALMVVGGFNVYEDRQAYQVAFKQPGEGCGMQEVELDVGSGAPLYCGPAGLRLPDQPPPSFPGFTAEQNKEVLGLALELGKDGLPKAEQDRVQEVVDRYAARTPPSALDRDGWWGAPRFWVGLVLAATGAVGWVVLRRTAG